MRRQREQLQSVAMVGVDGNFNLTAPQWQEPWCICLFFPEGEERLVWLVRGLTFELSRHRRLGALGSMRTMGRRPSA